MEIYLENEQKKSSRIFWLLSLRSLVFLLLLSIVLFILKNPYLVLPPFLAYSLLTLGFFALFLSRIRLPIPFLLDATVALQIVCELYLESVIVHSTGGQASEFLLLFLITIVSASLIYHLSGTVLVATAASFFCSWALLSEGRQFSFPSSKEFFLTVNNLDEASFYKLFLFFCSFYLVAFISGYLAQRLKREGEKLVSASAELDRVKMDTDDILRHLSSGLLSVDNLGNIIYFNKAAEEILGYNEKDIRDKKFTDVFFVRMPEFAEKLSETLESEKMHSRHELSVTSLKGKKFPIGMSTSILIDKDGSKRGLIAIFQDLTGAKKIEEQMRIKDRLAAVGELSAGIAHEIRNPLASISGSVEVLKGELKLAGENQKLMELILKESSRLNSILKEFLQYAKIKRTSLSKVDLVFIINEAVEIVKKHPSFREGIKIEKEFEEKHLWVWGEENQIKQLFLNLLVNGLEAMEEKGERLALVRKSLKQIKEFYFEDEIDEEERDWIPIAVIDNGKGMNKDQKEKLFWPFYSSKKNGTGLGLPIVQRLVNNLGGKIEFTSEVGKGSAFVVYFKKHKLEKETDKVYQTA